MKVSLLTLFPQLYEQFLDASLIGRARQAGILSTDLVNLFSFSTPKRRIDSPTVGHGTGMLIKPEIIEAAVDQQESAHGRAHRVFFSPHGRKMDQNYLKELAKKLKENPHLMLIAGRYEGMDARVEEYYADDIVSLGDFVLMGGDIPAMALLEGVSRYLPGVVGKEESVEQDSFSGPFVDYPEYTLPVTWKGYEIPAVLRSGNHRVVDEWRDNQAVFRSVYDHFAWVRSCALTPEQIAATHAAIPNHYSVLMHDEVMHKEERVGTSSVTSIDIHDISRSSATYGLSKFFIVSPLKDQKNIVSTLLNFWQKGTGLSYNPSRARAVKNTELVDRLDDAIKRVEELEGCKPLLVATSAQPFEGTPSITYNDQHEVWRAQRPVMLIFGTSHGLAPQVLERCDYLLVPVNGLSDFNHLSVRSAAAIVFDRWLGLQPRALFPQSSNKSSLAK